MTQFASDEDVFAGALAVPAAERSHYLARACAGDSEAESHLASSYRIVSTNQSADAHAQEVVRDRVARFYTERNLPDRLQTLIETPHQTPVTGQPLPGHDR